MNGIQRFQATPYVGPIRYSRGKHITDAYPEQQEASDFLSFFDMLHADRCDQKQLKHNEKGHQYFCGPLVCPHSGTAPHRTAGQADLCGFLTGDCDKCPQDKFAAFIAMLDDFLGCGYMTFSSTEDAPRFRFILALNRLVDRYERIRLGEAFNRYVASRGFADINLDVSVYKTEQACYLPVGNAQFWDHNGQALDVDALLTSKFAKPENIKSKYNAETDSAQVQKEYAKPLLEDMATVLLYVDAEDEQIYSDIANGLARTYGEDGRQLFLDYCSRSTIKKHQDDLASGEVDQRYSRAIRELRNHPEGYTCKHIIEVAQKSPHWPQHFVIHYENDFESDPNGLFGESMDESSFCNTDTLSELFSDMELRQEDVDAMDEAEIIFPNLIVKGHVQAIVSPANGGKTTIMVYVCEKLVATGMNVYYINVDGSPGDLKRHHAHAKQHGYTVLAPDARKGGSIQTIHTKLHALASGSLPLSNAVFVFDTLKKFVQVIDKSKAAAFFKLTRALSVKGATIVLLGHTNKHAGDDGQQVFEGTADLRNDVDELIYLDCYKNEGEGVLEVTTRPDKVRAELQPKTFTIDLNNGRTVRELGYTKNIIAKEKRLVLELFKEAISSGLHSQKDLLDYAEPKTSEGQPKLRKLLKEFTSWDKPEIVATQTGRGKDLKYTLAVG